MPDEKKSSKVDDIPSYRTTADLFPSDKFYPDIPKREFSKILDTGWLLVDARVLPDFSTKFGDHDLGQMLLQEGENKDSQFVTVCSGEVIINRNPNSILIDNSPKVTTE